jgi:very-short-patch-repair endonuclease
LAHQFAQHFYDHSDRQNNVPYIAEFNNVNYDDSVVKQLTDTSVQMRDEGMIPYLNIMYDIVQENNRIYQVELGRQLGFPETWDTKIGKNGKLGQRWRMFAELVGTCVLSGFLIEEERSHSCAKRYLRPGDRTKLPNFVYDFSRKHKSKNEALVNSVLYDLLKPYPTVGKLWGFAFKKDGMANKPYDFALFDKNDPNHIIGIIEVDGAQHYEKISHFHRNDGSFEKRQEIDELKTTYTNEQDIPLLRIQEHELKDKKKKYVNKLRQFIEDNV